MNLVLFVSIVIVLSAVYGGISAAPWLPTWKKDVSFIVTEILKKNPKSVADLGCGDGRFLFAIADINQEIECHGYEVFILPYLIAWVKKLSRPRRYKNVYLHFSDFFKKDLSRHDFIITFLLEKAYQKLAQKYSTLSKKALILTEAWKYKDIAPVQEFRKDKSSLPFYLYEAQQFQK